MGEDVGPGEVTDRGRITGRAELAAKLRHLLQQHERSTKKVKRAALARRIGVSESSLYAYLKGTTLPSSEALDLLLDAIAVVGPARGRILTARDALEAGGVAPMTPELPTRWPAGVPHPPAFAFGRPPIDRVVL